MVFSPIRHIRLATSAYSACGACEADGACGAARTYTARRAHRRIELAHGVCGACRALTVL
eukprot:8076801-Pyramimonas_sp.AAC.1